MEAPISLSEYIARRRPPAKVVELPEWRRRRLANRDRFVAVKDTSEWRPEPAA